MTAKTKQAPLAFKRPKTKPNELAAALVHVATESGAYGRAKSRAEQFDRLASNVPRRALLATMSGALDKSRPALRWAHRWAQENRSGILVLAGQPGTGKTVAAAWYAARTRAHWLSAPELGSAPYAEAGKIAARARAVPALVLDEVGGQGTTTDAAVDRIATLIADRFARMLPTVVTTNLDQGSFARLYDGVDDLDLSRLVDRVRESGHWLDVTHESLRGSPVELTTKAIDDARRLAQLVELAELMTGPGGREPCPRTLGELQSRLGVETGQLDTLVDEWRASRRRIDAMISDLLAKTAPDEDNRTDDERQADLRRQVELRRKANEA